MYDILKIKIQDIIKCDFRINLSPEEELNFIIRQQNTHLFNQLRIERGYDTQRINELIYVEAKHNKKREEHLKKLLREGFYYNDKKYVRFGKSASQAKEGITVFIDEEYFERLMERSQLGVSIDKCNISKYESYRNLILSSCLFVEGNLPYIVMVDEFKKILPNQYVRYAVEKDIEYTDKNSGIVKTLKKQRVIEEGFKDISQSPFDGFGVHTKEISDWFNKTLDNENNSIAFQIRLPFLKGMTVEVPFREFYKEHGINKIQDIFGNWHDVEKIDCIWNVTMWKAHGIFKKNFGSEAWNEYLKRVERYEYPIGISKYSHNKRYLNLYTKLNFQYLQCLDLINPKYMEQFKNKERKFNTLDLKNQGKIIKVASYSTELLEKIINGELLYTLKFLGINNTGKANISSKFVEAILINTEMLKDPCIKNTLKRKLNKTITQMKYGKIYAEGFYHIVVGDIIGYLEYAGGLKPVGCLNAGEFYSKNLKQENCLSFRSPLVDPSEVNKVKIVENQITKKYLSHFKDQDVCMVNMHDLSMQQQGGADMDGDIILLCPNKILVDAKIDLPIVVDVEDKKSVDEVEYNLENIIKYECNSRDSRIGEITNIATSILNQYTEDPVWKKINQDNVALLRLYQGKEIDFVKTGFRWVITKNLRRYLKRLPHFILYNYPKKLRVYNRIKEINKQSDPEDRIPYNSFKSQTAMNELCEYICQWERQNIKWDNKVSNNGYLLIDNTLDLSNQHIINKIKSIYSDFKKEFLEVIKLDDEDALDILYDKYKEKIFKINIDKKLLANYCIKVAYRSISEEKHLCWVIFGDEMLENLRTNSPKNIQKKIIEVSSGDPEGKEFLGRYYKIVEVGVGRNAS